MSRAPATGPLRSELRPRLECDLEASVGRPLGTAIYLGINVQGPVHAGRSPVGR